MSAPDDLLDFAIAQSDDSARERGGFGTVRGHHGGGVFFASQTLEQFENDVPGGGVQVAGRFGREKKARRVDQRAGNSDALHLSAGKLVGEAVTESIELDPTEPFAGGFARVGFPSEKQRQFDVFENGQRVEQLEGLKNESDFFAAQMRQSGILQ